MVSEETPPSHERHTQELNVNEAVDIAYEFAHSVFQVIIIFFYWNHYWVYISIMWWKMYNLWSNILYIGFRENFNMGVRLVASTKP